MIRVPEVRLVGENIEPGVYKIAEALRFAEEQEVDLVEISPNAEPPVCKLMDYGKFLYQQKKRDKELKAKSTQISHAGRADFQYVCHYGRHCPGGQGGQPVMSAAAALWRF